MKEHLAVSYNIMEVNANRKRREVEFAPGDSVLVKLRPYHHISVAKRISNKLSKHYYGPFIVTERVGKVSYRLALPATSRIHLVFHVSVLPPFKGQNSHCGNTPCWRWARISVGAAIREEGVHPFQPHSTHCHISATSDFLFLFSFNTPNLHYMEIISFSTH